MSDEPTTVSWKVIEPKWKVISADDAEVVSRRLLHG
jgi:hypothetical protein